MDAETPYDVDEASHEILAPDRQTLPLVFASPHSGRNYRPEFLAASRLDPLALRRSEDSFVDELFAWAPRLGAPLIRALFPRAFVDANREPFELDPAMFEDSLPSYANTLSPRVAAGLGTIARVVANGADIYRGKLSFDEAQHRLRRYYWPYHRALANLVERTRAQFGHCILVDCHSMPSAGGPRDRARDNWDSRKSERGKLEPGKLERGKLDREQGRIDFVLGDCHGRACAPAVIDAAELALRRLGYRVARNAPYSGGFVTRHYGRPDEAVHGLQIEINRGLYMDEARIRRAPAMEGLKEDLRAVIAALGAISQTKMQAA
jgi:N-formylglutamate amidohydrolase